MSRDCSACSACSASFASNNKFYSQEKYLDFKDVLVVPRFSKLNSRQEVNLERRLHFQNRGEWTGIPIIAANMTTTGTREVYRVLSRYKIITAFHKFYTLQDYEVMMHEIDLNPDYFMISTGITDADLENLDKIIKSPKIPSRFICIDIANGYIERFYQVCQDLRKRYPDKILVAGNVVTRDAVERLAKIGIDIVKMGIGPGSACTTRIQTGVGMPQLTCILDAKQSSAIDNQDKDEGVENYRHRYPYPYIISDGGITCPGDCVKAFVAGADFVMIGGEFSGHDENPGSIIEESGNKYKLFYGMSSQYAMKNNYTDGRKNYRSSEGRVLKIKYKGSLIATVNNYLGGIRSACTYTDSESLSCLAKNGRFIMVNNQYNSHLL